MGLTYDQLKQNVQDWLENSSTSFTTATGSGKAPIDLCIELAELRIAKEVDLTAFRKVSTLNGGCSFRHGDTALFKDSERGFSTGKR
jgi:hypothetical protein